MNATVMDITATPVRRSAPITTRWALTRAVAVATLLAGAVTETLTAVVRAGGVRLALDAPSGHAGTALTFGACAFSIALCVIPGAVLAAATRRWAKRPARTFTLIAVALTVVSLVAPLAEPATSTATRLTLIAAHLLAAAAVIPIVARRLP